MSIHRVALSLLIVSVAALSAAAETEVSGVFLGNGQPAKLAFVSARKGSPVGGKEVIKLVITENKHSQDDQPELKALFGNYGSALVIGIQPDGNVVTCDIRHEAHTQKPISSPAAVKMNNFKSEAGQISGRLTGKGEAFGQTWEIELSFKAQSP